MFKNLTILAVLAIIVALPFVFRRSEQAGDWRKGDPVLTIITPHNEAIRYEFEHAFSRWHAAHHNRADGSPQPVRIEWRNVGGTTEISRYLSGEYATSTRAWWTQTSGKSWPNGATEAVVASKPPVSPDAPPVTVAAQDVEAWKQNQRALIEVYKALRSEAADSPNAATSGVDLFFGGGSFDHSAAFSNGFTVEPWKPDAIPPDVAESFKMIPTSAGGETWRTPSLFGNAISTFGIVYNVDRLRELSVSTPPKAWNDLADFRYFGQVGVTDPTKSGSIAKAFEMLVHQQMHDAARAYLRTTNVGDDQVDATIAANEKRIVEYKVSKSAGYQRGDVPEDLKGYQAALEQGWLEGIYLVQAIGANARYFTDSATKVSIDVSIGDAAVGMTIDFYGRFQAQAARAPDGTERMKFVTPAGGTSVSCDPISLLRGAPHRDLACEFIAFVISPDGQKLWTYAPGAKNDAGVIVGNEKYALRRLPIRRDFYASTQPAIEAAHVEHKQYAVDDLADPSIDPYQLAKQFTYYPRWTGEHFSIMRDITRVMCMDSGQELRAAWSAVHQGSKVEEADARQPFRQLPTVTLHKADGSTVSMPLTWRTAPDFRSFNTLEVQREWTEAFRKLYRDIARSGNAVTQR